MGGVSLFGAGGADLFAETKKKISKEESPKVEIIPTIPTDIFLKKKEFIQLNITSVEKINLKSYLYIDILYAGICSIEFFVVNPILSDLEILYRLEL